MENRSTHAQALQSLHQRQKIGNLLLTLNSIAPLADFSIKRRFVKLYVEQYADHPEVVLFNAFESIKQKISPSSKEIQTAFNQAITSLADDNMQIIEEKPALSLDVSTIEIMTPPPAPIDKENKYDAQEAPPAPIMEEKKPVTIERIHDAIKDALSQNYRKMNQDQLKALRRTLTHILNVLQTKHGVLTVKEITKTPAVNSHTPEKNLQTTIQFLWSQIFHYEQYYKPTPPQQRALQQPALLAHPPTPSEIALRLLTCSDNYFARFKQVPGSYSAMLQQAAVKNTPIATSATVALSTSVVTKIFEDVDTAISVSYSDSILTQPVKEKLNTLLEKAKNDWSNSVITWHHHHLVLQKNTPLPFSENIIALSSFLDYLKSKNTPQATPHRSLRLSTS